MSTTQNNAPRYVGIDIGGTNTRLATFHATNSPTFSLLAKFPTQQSYEQQLQLIISALEGQSYAGIGISIAARLAKDGREVIVAPNLPEYVGKPMAQNLADTFKCPIRLAHDAVCGLLAEKKFGAMHNFDRCAYLTVSTGTGAAIQLRKSSTALTSSIEIGHQILDGNARLCLCGQIGCLETFTGGRQLELRYGRPVAFMSDSDFWETYCEKLSLGLVNLAQLTRIDALAISGAIALNKPSLLTSLQQKIDTLLKGSKLELSFAALKEDAPLVGAAILLTIPESTILH